MKNLIAKASLLLLVFAGFYACQEQGRFEMSSDDTVPPHAPEYLGYEPLYGGARLHYNIPADEDLLSIDASYTATNGKVVRFSVSYYSDTLDVFGFADTIDYTVQLYAIDRAGNKSEAVPVTVRPSESAVSRVAKTVLIKPSFGAFLLEWENELMQDIKVFVDFSFSDNGTQRSFRQSFSSRKLTDRRFVNDLNLSPQEPVKVQITIEDVYGNRSKNLDMGQLFLYTDTELPKNVWTTPAPNDSIGGVPMGDGYCFEGRIEALYDGIIDKHDNNNFANYYLKGRTGRTEDGWNPWNVFIDLGDYYELSRIRTYQRRFEEMGSASSKGILYGMFNVGIFNMYRWDEETGEWEFLSQAKIPIPTDLSEQEIINQALAGDLNFMFPDEHGFTKPTRLFRYEALFGFLNNYTDKNCYNLSEITLYGRKATK